MTVCITEMTVLSKFSWHRELASGLTFEAAKAAKYSTVCASPSQNNLFVRVIFRLVLFRRNDRIAEREPFMSIQMRERTDREPSQAESLRERFRFKDLFVLVEADQSFIVDWPWYWRDDLRSFALDGVDDAELVSW